MIDKDYQPSKMKKVYEDVKDFGKGFAIGFYIEGVKAPYMLPSIIREALTGKTTIERRSSEKSAESYGIITGALAGLTSIFFQARIYTNSDKPLWLIPAITNAASLIYETGIRPFINKKANKLEIELDKPTLQIDK